MTVELKYPLASVKEVFNKWLYLENQEAIDIALAIAVANKLATDPLWALFVGSPSECKTEILRCFDGYKNAYFLSSLTPHTLVSGKESRKDPSLLPKLNDKLLVLKDFTSILTMRSESQQEVLSQLREIADGKYDKPYGTGKEFHWRGKVGLLGAVTGVYDLHYGVIGMLGDRFLLYRLHTRNGESMGVSAEKNVGREDEMREEIRTAVHTFLDQFDDLKNVNFDKDKEITQKIISLASFCATARCPVERDRYHQNILTEPTPEGTARLVKQFKSLGMGLALVNGKTCVDEAIFKTIKKVGQDLLPGYRLKIIRHVWNEQIEEDLKGWNTTGDIAQAINAPKRTVLLHLENMMVLDMVNRKTTGEDEQKSTYEWQLSSKFIKVIERTTVLDKPKNNEETKRPSHGAPF